MPMLNKGNISALKIEYQVIDLIDGEVIDGFLKTKDYGAVRMLGVGNPVYLWVTPEQRDRLMKLK